MSSFWSGGKRSEWVDIMTDGGIIGLFFWLDLVVATSNRKGIKTGKIIYRESKTDRVCAKSELNISD